MPFQSRSGATETYWNTTGAAATQCRSNPVSSRRLPETGIFQIAGGDYRRFCPGSGQTWSLETDRQCAKARHWRAFLALRRVKSPCPGLAGWGGRIRTSVWWNQNLLPACHIGFCGAAITELRSRGTVMGRENPIFPIYRPTMTRIGTKQTQKVSNFLAQN